MEKLSWRQQILSFKSENGFCDAVNNGTLTPIRTVQLAELVGKSHAEPVDFLTDGAIGTGMVNEDGVAYTKSLAKATDPHDLAFGKHLPCLLVNECAPLGRRSRLKHISERLKCHPNDGFERHEASPDDM